MQCDPPQAAWDTPAGRDDALMMGPDRMSGDLPDTLPLPLLGLSLLLPKAPQAP